jgi:hypothetical protein
VSSAAMKFRDSGWALRRKSDGAWWTHSGKGPRRMRLWSEKPKDVSGTWDAVEVVVSGMVSLDPESPDYVESVESKPEPPLSFRDQCAIALTSCVLSQWIGGTSSEAARQQFASNVFDLADAMDLERIKREKR